MIEIESVSGTGIPVLGDYTLKLNQYPLVVIRGVNLNKMAFSKNRSNGSGKTLSVSTIPAVVYNSTPKSLKKRGAKDILKLKKSSMTLRFKNRQRYSITQALVGSSVKYKIAAGDTENNYREARDAQDAIRGIFPITEEQFFSQVFIDGRERTILQRGSAAQRFAYIETVFNLNQYDALAKLINRDHAKIKASIQELEILIGEKQTRKKDLPALDRLKTRAQQKRLELDVGRFSERVEHSMEHINKAKTYIKLIEDAESLNLKQLQLDLEDAGAERATMRKLYRKSVEYWEQERVYRNTLERRRKLKTLIREIDGDVADIPVVKQRIKSLEEKLKEAEDVLSSSLDMNKEYIRLKNVRDKLDVDYVLEKYIDESAEAIKDRILANRNRQADNSVSLTNLINFSDSGNIDEHCPVCRRALDKRGAALLEKSIEADQVKLRLRLQKLETTYRYVLATAALKQYGRVPKHEIEDLESVVNKTRLRIKHRQSALDILETKKDLEQQLQAIPQTDFVESARTPKPEVYEDTIADLEKRIQALEYNVKVLQRVKRMDFDYANRDEAETALQKHTRRISEYRPVLEQMQAQMQTLSTQTSIYDVVRADVDRLIEKIKALRIETKDFKIYEALRRAYGSRGLKKLETASRVQQLESNFNKFAPLIYGERVRFEFRLTESKFDIFIEINGTVMDVRMLSGGESSAFTLLLILSLLPFVPYNNRCSLLVLDEIEIGADDSFKEMFVEKYLPVLQKVIPHIVVITPQSPQQFYIPNAANYVVTKRGTRSTIKHVL